MIRTLQVMMRDEPVTFGVMLMMIAILLFGAWSSWPTARKTATLTEVALLAKI